MGKVKTHVLLSAVTGTGSGEEASPNDKHRSFHLTGFTSAGAGAASVTVEVSNDGVNFVVQDTLTLTLGTTITSDVGVFDEPYKYVRGNVGSISGTDAQVTLTLGSEVD